MHIAHQSKTQGKFSIAKSKKKLDVVTSLRGLESDAPNLALVLASSSTARAATCQPT